MKRQWALAPGQNFNELPIRKLTLPKNAASAHECPLPVGETAITGKATFRANSPPK
jgi:hypothetical protein